MIDTLHLFYIWNINTKICPYQDIAGCKVACLNTAGRGVLLREERPPM